VLNLVPKESKNISINLISVLGGMMPTSKLEPSGMGISIETHS
jgi:hypothetical protein